VSDIKKRPTKQAELWAALCGEGDEPYPIEALWTIEGLNYIELQKLYRSHEKGEPLPDWRELDKAVRRREMAAALGVTDPEENGELARQAGNALDRVATAAKRIGVELRVGRGSRDELLRVATAIFSAAWFADGDSSKAVKLAQALIADVDKAMAADPKPVRPVDQVFGETVPVDKNGLAHFTIKWQRWYMAHVDKQEVLANVKDVEKLGPAGNNPRHPLDMD
jgi:hypothetical protein